jgi:SAM-dependent methyltransferase
MDTQNLKSFDTTEAWQQALMQSNYYEHHCNSLEELAQIKRLNRVWKRILELTKTLPPAQLFELGCGGGIHMASLALNGFHVHGIDVSEEVARKAKEYLSEVDKFQDIQAKVEIANIFDYQANHDSYDMCFHFGVVEHFLRQSERKAIWQKLKDLTKPNGWIVSVVPCGQHFMRGLVRERGLGGYNIPEIDYSCFSHQKEFEAIGLSSIRVLTHNYFSFLSCHPSKLVSKVAYPILFLTGNLVIPSLPISEAVTERWAHTLIAVGQKTD